MKPSSGDRLIAPAALNPQPQPSATLNVFPTSHSFDMKITIASSCQIAFKPDSAARSRTPQA